MERKIDLENWPRKQQYDLFRHMDYPHFNICANLDITEMYNYVKKNNIPFFKAMVYIATKTANEIKEFRYRIRGNDVIEHETVHPSFTIMSQPEVFSFCSVDYNEAFSQFSKSVDEKRLVLEGKVYVDDEPEMDNRLYITSLPWVTFTSVSHPIHIKSVDSVPRIAWGKFFEENHIRKMPLSVQVNHAVMDGVHVGKYFELLQDTLNNPENVFGK